MDTNWKVIEAKIFALIEKNVQRIMTSKNEQWVSAKELSERIPIFSQDFIKRHGECLPREKMEYYNEDGTVAESRYMYPINAINLMVQKGVFRTANGTLNAVNTYNLIKA